MSAVVHFNTLHYVEKLRAAGISEEHAKAEAEALMEALAESTSGTLATKDDINDLKLEMAELRSEMKLSRWMLATLLAGVISLVIKTFFI
mgnify:FL=1